MPASRIQRSASLLEAFIVPSGRPSILTGWTGPSAAAWELREHELQGDRGAFLSPTADSDESEALIGALLDITRHPMTAGELYLYCRQKWLCDSIICWLPMWAAGGWRRPRRHRAEWMAFQKICAEKQLKVIPIHVPADDLAFKDVFNLLEQIVKYELDGHARRLGAPTGGFDEFSGGGA